jgi:DNA polymerase I-like protein with 3'-5' exonuclease and polymerase domains/intein/homing endonuclease
MEVYFQLINDAEGIKKVYDELGSEEYLGFDTETTELDPYEGNIRLVQLSNGKSTYVIDLKPFATRGDLRTMEELALLRELLAAPKPIKIAHNAKFDAKWIRHHLGTDVGGIFDTLLASQIIAAGDQDRRHNLAEVANFFLGIEVDKSEQVSDWNAAELSQSQVQYAAKDALIMVALREKVVERLKQDNLIQVAKLEFDCVMPIAAMELNGFYLDEARWREQLEKVKKQQEKIAAELQKMLAAGVAQASLFGVTEINLDSQQQVTDALVNLGVPVPASTRGWQLEPLALEYPVIAKLLEYRGVAKSISSFGENILEFIKPQTGRIHSDFRQIGAPTGRFSSSKPNIQQIPHDEAYRRCFRAPEGRKLVIADYCVAKGTRIATERGLVPIEEMQLSDRVCLENGLTTPISGIIRRGKLPTIKLTLKNGYTLKATELHRIRVIDVRGNYVWKRIGELKKTDFVVIQPSQGINQREDYEILPEIEFNHPNNSPFETPKFADENLALFFGYVCGDGSYSKRSIKWVVNQQDADLAEWIDKLSAKLFGLEIHRRPPYRGVFESMINSTPLVSWCKDLNIGKDCVPDFLWKSKKPVVSAFLRGLFESDGSVTDSDTGKVSFAASREVLARQVHQLLLALGIPATLRQQKGTGPGKKFNCWSISIVAGGLRQFAHEIGFISGRKQQKLNSLLARWTGKTVVGNMPNLKEKIRSLSLSGEARRLLNNTSSMSRPVSKALAYTIEQNYPAVAESLNLKHLTEYNQLFLPVVSMENVGEEEVFDLSVPNVMTYISDGFVSHNSQIELRILAEFSNDENFIKAFISGADFHTITAAQVFGVKPEEVSSEQRSFAKRLNFGVVYGIGASRFALMTGLSQTQAEDTMRKYFTTYRGLDAWLRDAARKVVTEKTSRTASGRLYRFRFDDGDRQQIGGAQRNAKNFPIQGTSADILKRALHLLHREMIGTAAKLVNIVHDEIIVECAASEAESIADKLNKTMCAAGEEYVKKVPVKVDIHIADEWTK